MELTIKHFLRVGIVLHVAYLGQSEGIGLLSCLEKIARDTFFEEVEITSVPDASIRSRAKDIIETSGLCLGFGGQGLLLGKGLSLADTDKSRRQESVDAVKRGIEEAAELGAMHFQFMSGTYDPLKKEEAFENLLVSTDSLCQFGEKVGMPLVCEVFDYDVDKKALIGSSDLAARYAGRVRCDHPDFGLQIDLSHIPLQHESIEDCVRTTLPYIRHVHIGNAVVEKGCEAYGDMHPRFGFPHSANGVEELARFLRVLLKTGYLSPDDRKIVCFEVRPWKDEPPELVIANAKRTLEAAWTLA